MKANNKNMTLDQKIDLAIQAFHNADVTKPGCNVLQERIEAMFNVLSVEDVQKIVNEPSENQPTVSK